jgi:hypothetical protein
MPNLDPHSTFHIEKHRAAATVLLSNGETVHGFFFVAVGSPHHDGPELVGELLNGDAWLLPFERSDRTPPRTVLYNRSSVITVSLSEAEARRIPGSDVATRRVVSLLLSTNARITGTVSIFRPEGRDRLSDWACDKSTFRYIETDGATLLVNVAYIVEVSETERGNHA